MEKVSLRNLPEETYLNTRVFLDDKYILLSPDVPVTSEIKARLEKWGFNELFTEQILPRHKRFASAVGVADYS